MLTVYEEIKKLQSEVKELEKEYEEKKKVLEEKSEQFKEEYLFQDLHGASEYQYGPTIEGALGLSIGGKYINDFDFACNFYQKYNYVREYVKMMESSNDSRVTDPFAETIENINILGKYIYNDSLNLSNNHREKDFESKEPIRDFAEYEYPISLYTGTPVAYMIAIVAMRLEKVDFQELYALKLECDNRYNHIKEVKEQINNYKIEVGLALIKGSEKKAEQVFNTVVKPGIDKGIKLLIKKLTLDDDQNNEE